MSAFHAHSGIPATPRAAPAGSGGGRENPTCSFHRVTHLLGCSAHSDARACKFITALIADEGFPPPLPHHRHGGSKGGPGIERGVAPRSMWIRAAVLQWLEDSLTPAITAGLDAAARSAAASEMDAAASGLYLIDGGRS